MNTHVIEIERQKITERIQHQHDDRSEQQAYTIPVNRLPNDWNQWVYHAGSKPREAWRFIMELLMRYAMAPIPKYKQQNLMHLHDLTLTVELMAGIPTAFPTSIGNTIPSLGRQLWEYYTGEVRANAQFRQDCMVFWWQLILRLRFEVVRKAPAHAIFLHWYDTCPLLDILQPNITNQFKAYLEWAHIDGFLAHEPLESTHGGQEDPFLQPYVREAEASITEPRKQLPFAQRKVVADVIPYTWQMSPVSKLSLSMLWRVLLLLHAEWHSLIWSPNAELLILLLWHHLQAFVLNEIPNEAQWYDDSQFTDPENVYQVSEQFIRKTEIIFASHLEVIRTHWHHITQVKYNDAPRALRILCIDIDDAGMGTEHIHATTTEVSRIEHTMREIYNTGQLSVHHMDVRVARTTYSENFLQIALLPGETYDMAERLPAVHLKPALIIDSLRPHCAKSLSTLCYADDAYTLTEQCYQNALPKYKSDLHPYAEMAHAVMLRAVLSCAENSRGGGSAAVMPVQARASISSAISSYITQYNIPTETVNNQPRHLYAMAQQALDSKTQAARDRHILECLPSIRTWWTFTQDTKTALPLRGSSAFKWYANGPSLPRLLYVRGAYWVLDDAGTFFVETTCCLDALRAFVCCAALKYPEQYKTHIESLLCEWFGNSAAEYAIVGKKYTHANTNV